MSCFNRKTLWWPILSMLLLAGCGGGGGGGSSTIVSPGATSSVPLPSGSNSVAVTLAPSTAANPQINLPYISVTLCVGGTCAQINDVLVDTGSYGFRVAASVLATTGLTLPQVTTSGAPLAECAQFAGGYMWGLVRSATLQIGGETTATSIPIQVTDDITPAQLPAPDAGCTSSGTLQNIGPAGANGIGGNAIIGLGALINDGQRYYSCSGGVCTFVCSGYGVSFSTSCSNAVSEVGNPVASFTQDNNGIILQMDGVATNGSVIAGQAGLLTFGLNTQTNNMLTNFQMVPHAALDPTTNPDGSYFSISYGCNTCNPTTVSTTGFFDTGSNYAYLNLSTSQLRLDAQYVYNLVSANNPVPVSATIASSTMTSYVVSNPINSNCPTCNAYNDIAASASNSGIGSQADLGMPYFYGRSIAFAIEGRAVSGQAAPTPFYAVKNP
jgi:hypothetical protein